ncbi:MAG TPA: DNA polymerase III subunit epsilon [Aestuariivirgaceae bacterium]|jgi:DNA polymerase-3 subunit epsilon
MREIILDTETTGLDPNLGHRIVEIGAVELIHHVPTGRYYHQYVHPQRTVPPDAFAVHGLSEAFLRDKPCFPEIADGLADFLGAAKLVIHNAAFDLAFLNAEFTLSGRELIGNDRVIDTLLLARQKHPLAANSLDALCKRYSIDNSRRQKHGALLDAELLAEVYIELIGGKQPALTLATVHPTSVPIFAGARVMPRRQAVLPPRITEAEIAAHRQLIDSLGPRAVWRLLA